MQARQVPKSQLRPKEAQQVHTNCLQAHDPALAGLEGLLLETAELM